MLGRSITRNGVILSLFALLTTGALAFIYDQTAERIVVQERLAAERALLEIVSRDDHDNDMLADRLSPGEALRTQLHIDKDSELFIARQAGEATAVIVPSVAADGYGGAIKLLVGIHRDGRIAGVRVLNHKETPGLGDKIELAKSDWILSFKGKSLKNPPPEKWKVKKDGGVFDQFTGATITPRAVVNQIKQSLQAVEQAHNTIFEDKQSSSVGEPKL